MNEHELLWAILPEGLEKYFDIEGFEKDDLKFRIILVEKNIIPENLPEKYRGKRIVNTVIKASIIDDFPLRGRKVELLVKRRIWKFEGIDEMYKREIPICAGSTQLEKEFADFLKDPD